MSNKINHLQHRFVEYIPETLEKGLLYVSIEHDIVVHLCCCGCGNQVVTALSPAEWSLTYNGNAVSLHPSIGNWGLPCQSHYWIRNGRVDWARAFSSQQIQNVRSQDRADQAALYGASTTPPIDKPPAATNGAWYERFWRWIAR